MDVELPSYFYTYPAGNAGSVSGAAVVVGAQAPSNDWRFAERYIGGKFQEYMRLSNFSTTTINASLILEYDSGSTLTVPVQIAPQDRVKEDINGLTARKLGRCSNPCTPTQNVSAEITATSGSNFVAERQLYFQYHHVAKRRSLRATGGTVAIGQSGAAATASYSSAEGYTNVAYDEWLTLQNPTGSQESIDVTLVNGNGLSYSFPENFWPKTRATVDLIQATQAYLCAPGAPAQCWEISMTARSTTGSPFVAERPLYFNASGSQGDRRARLRRWLGSPRTM